MDHQGPEAAARTGSGRPRGGKDGATGCGKDYGRGLGQCVDHNFLLVANKYGLARAGFAECSCVGGAEHAAKESGESPRSAPGVYMYVFGVLAA